MEDPSTPYSEIFDGLFAAVMQAQAEVILALHGESSDKNSLDALINRHFLWLCLMYPEGINSHLFGTSQDLCSLRPENSTGFQLLSLTERDSLRRREFTPTSDSSIVPRGVTRISQLIKKSIIVSDKQDYEIRVDESRLEPLRRNPQSVYIRSPLCVIFDYLTVPDMPASRSYALLPLRNYIFETFGAVPRKFETSSLNPSRSLGLGLEEFDMTDIEYAYARVDDVIAMRNHQESLILRAQDAQQTGNIQTHRIAVTVVFSAARPVEYVLDHFLAACGFLWFAFATFTEAVSYLRRGVLRSESAAAWPYRFSVPFELERIPELGEIVNELWGLPIPIRGADTLFRGGLKFSAEGGLVVGLHGGPGTGKTTLALSLGVLLAPFGIKTIFITAEEAEQDLTQKAKSLLASDLRRLSFFAPWDWLRLRHLGDDAQEQEDAKELIARRRGIVNTMFESVAKALNAQSGEMLSDSYGVSKSCRAIVVMDGVHDLIMSASDYDERHPLVQSMRAFISLCRKSKALVILTTGEDWEGQSALDYLVDVAIKLSQDNVGEYGRRPDRQITLSKARHQLCAIGSHGLQITGSKGIRFSPQINYQLDRKTLWKTPLPDMSVAKRVMCTALSRFSYEQIYTFQLSAIGEDHRFELLGEGPSLFRGSNIFLNGEGSGGKAALALKIAISPSFELGSAVTKFGRRVERAEKVMVISFLYPSAYYRSVVEKLLFGRFHEYGMDMTYLRPSLKVIHLYPGNYRPDQLFNRIEWELNAAELEGDPYTSIVIDGLHNIYLQFPEIESYTLFWPQFFASLRARAITVISTHTTFMLQGSGEESYRLDDKRSEPLRHALVQKTDFTFEIDPYVSAKKKKTGVFEKPKIASASNVFGVRVFSAINQAIPETELMWSREHLVLFKNEESIGTPQRELPFDLI